MPPFFSIIVPVYNRPVEVKELMESLAVQTLKDFELVLVEDGSTDRCDTVAEAYRDSVNFRYFFKENSGRSLTRNYGMDQAQGSYFVFFDSDCVIPPTYFEIVKRSLDMDYCDSYGGPDSADASFSDMQKAISHSMTSFLTTGGIRGGRKGLEKFTPRTFNMGFSAEVYKTVGGFEDMFGEDIDLSLRIRNAGFSSRLIPEAFVFHKRRNNFKSFFRQVHVFGMARIELFRRYPESLKIVHALPALFLLATIFCVLLSFRSPWFLLPLLVYFLAVFAEAFFAYKKFAIAALAVATTAVQLYGYGYGFLKAFVKQMILKRGEGEDLEKYYKKK